ncbi:MULTISPECIES: MaoC/PaaZ C-terminal domain-containing protein [unclassified Natronococcus]|uniref:MaoC/PaaZ C-terminal domain-containing protein n=1 Tax=unclassified Natronococcus TaxID=2623058 RepID=UPI00241F33F4|nr:MULTISPECIES: MaoC/PaaZ C-terminal domain-containing protein [unclassified Natronococcus]MDG5818231.1 MaoC/PaaZ C-terminal domain-containing protein [Natronococcus sp. A-GB7]
MHRPTEGESHAFERTFTTEEVRQFAELSRDTQPRHTEPDEEGRLLVHGLLTATLPTKIGGDLEVLASSMTFEFRRPVYTGERIVCTWSYERVDEREDRYDLVAAVDCENDAGETVLSATVEGLIWKER